MPVVNLSPVVAWFGNGRGIAASGGLVVGFLVALVIFGAPWHLPPAWGDIPTWIAAVFAGTAAVVALSQLGTLQRQLREETERNVTRDKLMDRQLAEAERRADADRRRQAEEVTLTRFAGEGGAPVGGSVGNASRRPITDVACKVMSNGAGRLIAEAVSCGQYIESTGNFGPTVQMRTQRLMIDEQPVSRYVTLPPDARCWFDFEGTGAEADHVLVVWFTDDAGIRWCLDEFQHLAPVKDGDEPG